MKKEQETNSKEAVTYEYGIMSNKFSIVSDNKLLAYGAMIAHYAENPSLIVIYSPEEAKEDGWCFQDDLMKRFDEIYGGKGSFDKFFNENVEALRACAKTITRIV